ncbi:FMN-binding negative transcriptional regulator [Microbacterium sp. ARD32]|uniref:FMN-binding negative transcriptional regulator n=1 Tax=Microbacterium sp. ARD32 TaxID=2962577 RepID=UPI002881FF74|nr:FMN-binding negative transcriptional regulator [Microbacterium sp. ARD32]MDT0157328.1 FMN-binding negative transcriptional regulator [Microbacterium sp. ARD32]
MRQNPSFAMTDIAELRRVVEQNPWATLVAQGDDGMVASHYPVLLDPERDDLTIVGHVGMPDDQVLHLGERELLVIFQGPHGYISPSWYGDVRAVPTWNYTAVHLSGIPEIVDTTANLRILDDLVTHFERALPQPRMMWELPNTEEFVRALESGTVGFRLTPTTVSAKRKLSQNKPDRIVENVIAELDGNGEYAQPELAAEMRRARQARLAHRR